VFKCDKCGRSAVRRASFIKGGHRVVCAFCNTSQVIRQEQSILDTETLTQEPEALVFVEPEQYEEEEVTKYPWLEVTPEEQYEEMRRELDLPPEVEIPVPGEHVPTVFPEKEPVPGVPVYEHDPKFYEYNMYRLWDYGWETIGNQLGDDFYTELAQPILAQVADDPGAVEKLFTPKGGTYLRSDFRNSIVGNMYTYLRDRGIDLQMGGGEPGEAEYMEAKFPELSAYAYGIMFRKENPEYLGPMPLWKWDPTAPEATPRSLEIPYLVKLLNKIRAWEGNVKRIWGL